MDHLHAAFEVRTNAVHLVGKDHTWYSVAVGLTPHGFRLRLDAGDGVEQRHRAIEHAQRPLHLDGEVNVTRGVDDVDAVFRTVALGIALPMALPKAGGRSRSDRDATFLFLLHPIHGGRTVMHFTNLVRLPRVIENPLSRGGLAGIDVGHDANISIML